MISAGNFQDNRGRLILFNTQGTWVGEVTHTEVHRGARIALATWTEKAGWLRRLFGGVDTVEVVRYVSPQDKTHWTDVTNVVSAGKATNEWLNDRFEAINVALRDQLRERVRRNT